jgi:ankyrin repeat protein
MTNSALDDEPEVVENPGAPADEDVSDKSESESESESEPEEEEEEDENDERSVQKRAKKKFDKIITDLKDDTLKFGDIASAKAYLQQNAAIITKTSIPKGQTLLHLLAETDKDELNPRQMKHLVTALVQHPDNLLAVRDKDNKTPLFCAISLRNHRLAKYMCEAHSDADSILKIPRSIQGNAANCLHQAIINKSSAKDDDLAAFLIPLCSVDTLKALDENGLTPLHLAVEYPRCDEPQLKIVEALINKCDKALEMTYEHPKLGLLSPYRYHELTFREATKDPGGTTDNKVKKVDRDGAESVDKGTTVGPTAERDRDRERGAAKPSMQTPNPMERPSALAPPQQPQRRGTHIEAPAGKFGPGKATVPDPRGRPLPPIVPVSGPNPMDPKTPSAAPKKKKPTTKKPKIPRSRATEASAQEIKKFLKLYYLRKKKHEEALEFLYGPNADRQIYFDLTGSGPTLDESRITEGLKHMQCEDILQYVCIPQVKVEPVPVPTVPGKRVAGPDGLGRSDLQILFGWLRDTQKVRTVLKVIVDDLVEPAHKDEAIENCLSGMGIETWDWRKTDLCSDVILKVAPMARIVHLYWSGNNAVLRGWSDREGLTKLNRLEKVILHVQQVCAKSPNRSSSSSSGGSSSS